MNLHRPAHSVMIAIGVILLLCIYVLARWYRPAKSDPEAGEHTVSHETSNDGKRHYDRKPAVEALEQIYRTERMTPEKDARLRELLAKIRADAESKTVRETPRTVPLADD